MTRKVFIVRASSRQRSKTAHPPTRRVLLQRTTGPYIRSFRLDEIPEEFAICPAVPAIATQFVRCNKPMRSANQRVSTPRFASE